MPIYEYEPLHVNKGCDHCQDGFEAVQSMNDTALTNCPHCGVAVKRIVSAPNINKRGSDPLSPSNLAAKGFTQYRKQKKGVYKKTAGRGPDKLVR